MSTLMEAKKTSSEKKKKKSPLVFISELKQELKKVSWTTRAELISATKIVVGSIFLFGIGIYLVDFIIKGILGLLKNIVLYIFG